jgi:hypothetical protein
MRFGDSRRPDPPAAIRETLAHSTLEVAPDWDPSVGLIPGHKPVRVRVAP